AGDTGLADLIQTLKPGSPEQKLAAAQAVAKFGPKAKAAAPALAALIDRNLNDEVDEQAAIALGKIGPGAEAALPALMKRADMMSGSNTAPCRAALVAIGEIENWSMSGTRRILELGFGMPSYFAVKPETTLPQALELLNDADPAVR